MMGETRLSLSLLFRLGMRSAPPHARPTNVTVAFISNLLTNQIWPLHKNAPRGFTRVLGSRWNRRSQNICEGHGEERRPRARGSTSVWDNWGSNKKITPGPQFRNPSLPQHTDQSQIVRIFCAHVPLTKLSLGKYFRYQKILEPRPRSSQRPRQCCQRLPGLAKVQVVLGRAKNKKTNKQTGTILISPPRDIPLSSSSGDCHAQVDPACIIAQPARQR